MEDMLKIEEAAKYLGVTTQTLRNWDKDNKFPAARQKENNYRLYSLNDLKLMKSTLNRNCDLRIKLAQRNHFHIDNERDVRKFIAQLHKLLRDTESNSSIIERFDEITKLLLLMINYPKEIKQYLKNKNHAFIRQLFFNYLNNLSFSTAEKYKNIYLQDNTLYKCCSFLSKYTFINYKNDLKGIAYEQIIHNTFEKGDNQQFFTPKQIVSFMCDLIMPYALGGKVCDPAAGTGGFLIELLKKKANFKHFTALEIDERLAWVSGLNLEVHNAKEYQSFYLPNGGSLGKERKKFHNLYDVIITNPPFGSDFNDQEYLKDFVLGENRSSRRRGVLFIEQCLNMLKNNGYLVILIDDGVLNHSSNVDVREYILSNSELLAVFSLPESTFMPYASVKTSILLLQKKKKPKKTYSTFFAMINNVGRKPTGQLDYIYTDKGEEILNTDIPKIYNSWSSYCTSKTLTKSNDTFVANIFDTFKSEPKHLYRIDLPFHHFSRKSVRALLSTHKDQLVKLTELCIEVKQTIIPSKHMPDDTILYTGLAHIESNSDVVKQTRIATNSLKSNVNRYEKGDIIFSKMRPSLRKCVAIDFEEPGYCSAECIVLRLKPKYSQQITPKLLSAILRSDFVYGQIIHLVTGIGRPRVSKKDILNLLIPLPSPKISDAIDQEYAKNINEVALLKQKAKDILKRADSLQQQTTNSVIDKIIKGEK